MYGVDINKDITRSLAHSSPEIDSHGSIDNKFSTKVQRQFGGERTVFSTNGAGNNWIVMCNNKKREFEQYVC